MTARPVTAFDFCAICRGLGCVKDELTSGATHYDLCPNCEGWGVVPVLGKPIEIPLTSEPDEKDVQS